MFLFQMYKFPIGSIVSTNTLIGEPLSIFTFMLFSFISSHVIDLLTVSFTITYFSSLSLDMPQFFWNKSLPSN